MTTRIQLIKRGLEALIFTAEGDMRQAINNLQATFAGFKFINQENVFKVCDVPNLELMQQILKFCVEGNFNSANQSLY